MGSGRSDSLSRRDRTSFSRGTASRGITDRPPASLPAHSFRSWAVRSEVAQCNAGRIRSPLGCGWQGLPSAALATPLGAVFPSTFPTGRPTLPLAEKGSNPTKLAQRRLVFAIGRVNAFVTIEAERLQTHHRCEWMLPTCSAGMERYLQTALHQDLRDMFI
jgi:hypothetical protein